MDTFREQLARLREMVARNERCFGRDIMIVPELCGDGISVTRLQREEIDALAELLRRWDEVVALMVLRERLVQR